MQVTPSLEVGAHGITSRQVDDPYLFPGLHLDSTNLYGADPKLFSAGGGVEARTTFNRNFSLYAELDGGYADTLSVNVDTVPARYVYLDSVFDITTGDSVPVLDTTTTARVPATRLVKALPLIPGHTRGADIHHAFGPDNMAGLAGLDYSIRKFSGNLEYLYAGNRYFSAGNPSIKPAAGTLQKAKFTGNRAFEGHWLRGSMKSWELAAEFDWEAVGAVEYGPRIDTVGDNKILLHMPDSLRIAEYKSYGQPDFTYQVTENRFKGGLGFKFPIAELSLEPAFSYYYETRPMLKVDRNSTIITIETGNAGRSVNATEYTDAEGRLQMGAGLLYTPLFSNQTISNMRYKLEYDRIFINDRNGDDPDSTLWHKDDGYQQRVKMSAAAKFFKKRFGNKLDAGYRYKKKKERGETSTTYNVLDKFSVDIIPRKIRFFLQGYYTRTITDYLQTRTYVPADELREVYGGDAELKLGLTPTFSLSIKGGVENGYDDAQSGSENYKTFFGGLTANYLF
jgi:hypothetical protein